MQYNHLLQILQGLPPGQRVHFPNLGGRGNGFEIWAAGNSLFIAFGAEGYEAVVQPNHYASTLARYNSLSVNLKNKTSQYSDKHWCQRRLGV